MPYTNHNNHETDLPSSLLPIHSKLILLIKILLLWKQPGYTTTDEWIKTTWYLYTMEFYSAIKKNEILSYAGKWVELENVILSEDS
jgi:hypothetical protein